MFHLFLSSVAYEYHHFSSSRTDPPTDRPQSCLMRQITMSSFITEIMIDKIYINIQEATEARRSLFHYAPTYTRLHEMRFTKTITDYPSSSFLAFLFLLLLLRPNDKVPLGKNVSNASTWSSSMWDACVKILGVCICIHSLEVVPSFYCTTEIESLLSRRLPFFYAVLKR